MFRRFMIVCWVAFAISALVVIGGRMTYHYFDWRADELAPVFAEEYRNLSADADAAYYAGEELTIEQIEASLSSEKAWVESSQSNYRRSGEPALTVFNLGVAGAGFLLLCNIILHTAHWIWMGRKVR